MVPGALANQPPAAGNAPQVAAGRDAAGGPGNAVNSSRQATRNYELDRVISHTRLAPITLRRLSVARGPDGWAIEERWTSKRLKPYYSEFFVHNGHAFGFDGSLLACIDLENGKRKWKGGRYGPGQLSLFADQDLLLVVSESGELALVAAVPDKFTELARFPALKGKTWNHPVLVGDRLLVRNGQEMIAYRLSLAGS